MMGLIGIPPSSDGIESRRFASTGNDNPRSGPRPRSPAAARWETRPRWSRPCTEPRLSLTESVRSRDVVIEDVIRFLILDLKVKLLSKSWHNVLMESDKKFKEDLNRW